MKSAAWAANVRRLRGDRTHAAIEELAGASSGAVATWEKGHVPKDPEKVARAFGVTVADLLREPSPALDSGPARDEYTQRAAALELLKTRPEFAPVLGAVAVYRAKGDADPTVREWFDIARSLLADLHALDAPAGLGDAAPDVSPEALKRAKRSARR